MNPLTRTCGRALAISAGLAAATAARADVGMQMPDARGIVQKITEDGGFVLDDGTVWHLVGLKLSRDGEDDFPVGHRVMCWKLRTLRKPWLPSPETDQVRCDSGFNKFDRETAGMTFVDLLFARNAATEICSETKNMYGTCSSLTPGEQ